MIRDDASMQGRPDGRVYLVLDIHDRVWDWGIRFTAITLHMSQASVALRRAEWDVPGLTRRLYDQPHLAIAMLGTSSLRTWSDYESRVQHLIDREAIWMVETPTSLKGWEAPRAGRFISFGGTLRRESGDGSPDYDTGSPWDVELDVDPQGRSAVGSPWWNFGLAIREDPEWASRQAG
jgi:hypothetical protein